ncbi:MAG TPA: hypothetical protein VLN72_04275 [Gillisia sp.]|nr:hypothetical protein [Gillisia sp.]
MVPNHYKDIYFPEMMLRASPGGHFPFLENKEELKSSILDFRSKFEFEIHF